MKPGTKKRYSDKERLVTDWGRMWYGKKKWERVKKAALRQENTRYRRGRA